MIFYKLLGLIEEFFPGQYQYYFMEYATGQQKVAGHDASHTPGKLMVPVLFTSMVECLPDGGMSLCSER